MCLPYYPCKCPDMHCCTKDINATPAGRALERSGAGLLGIELGISWSVDWLGAVGSQSTKITECLKLDKQYQSDLAEEVLWQEGEKLQLSEQREGLAG